MKSAKEIAKGILGAALAFFLLWATLWLGAALDIPM